MKPSTSTAAFNVRLGAWLAEIREQAHVRQEEMATAARSLGLYWWSRGTVAAIERGGRGLFPVEMATLPGVLLSAGIVRSDAAALLRVTLDRLLVDWRGDEEDQVLQMTLTAQERRWGRRILERQPVADGVALSTSLDVLADSIRDLRLQAREEATVRAAVALQVPAIAVSIAAWDLWKRSLGAERDHRLRERTGSPEELQALRGHQTRQMVQDELAPLLAGPARARRTIRTRRITHHG
jgi:transcriptional regulator with XRE-family HTH domain